MRVRKCARRLDGRTVVVRWPSGMEGATLPAVIAATVELAAPLVPRLGIVPVAPRRARYAMPPPAPETGSLVDVYG